MPNRILTFGPPYDKEIRAGTAPNRVEQIDKSRGTFDIRNILTYAGSTQVIAGFQTVPPAQFGRGASQITLDADFSIVSVPMLAVALPGYALAEILFNVTMVPLNLGEIVSNQQSFARFVIPVFYGLGNNFINIGHRISVTFKPSGGRIINDQRFALIATVESWAGAGGNAQAEASVHEAKLDQFVVTCDF